MRKLTNELKEQISDFMFESQNRFGISLQYKYDEDTHCLIMNDEDIYFDKVSKILDLFPEKENSFRLGSFNSDTNIFNFTNDSKKYLLKTDIQKQSVEERRLR